MAFLKPYNVAGTLPDAAQMRRNGEEKQSVRCLLKQLSANSCDTHAQVLIFSF
jgi:hypothetical protein